MRQAVFLCLAIFCGATFALSGELATKEGHTINRDWVVQVLKQIETIKVGMTRHDLLKVFMAEGGISTRLKRTYVHKECEVIKVDVEFIPAVIPEYEKRTRLSESQNQTEMPGDQIIEISRPYLQWMILD